MKEKTKEILNKLDETKEIKRLRELNDKLNSNEEYKNIMKEFVDNKKDYIKDNTINEEIKKLRQKLFDIPEFDEYMKLQSKLRLNFIEINNIILSVIDEK